MDSVEELKRSIYELMKKNNMTCQEFSETLGYSIIDVDRILFGELLLTPVEIERIANMFGLTKRELMYYQEDKFCCLCGRAANHTKSFHCLIGNSVYHYCHWHSWIGILLHKKFFKKERLKWR